MPYAGEGSRLPAPLGITAEGSVLGLSFSLHVFSGQCSVLLLGV